MSSYINTEKEIKENPLYKDLDLPANLRVDDPMLFAKTEGRTMHSISNSVEIPLLDPFKTPIKTLPVFSIMGDQTSQSITLNNRVFGMPLREDILHRVVVWQVTSY